MDRVHHPIWRVTGEDGRQWVLKRLPEWPPGVSPVEEYRVLCYLQARGLPVAVPVVTDDGLIAHNADNLGTGPNEKRPTGPHAYAHIPLHTLPGELRALVDPSRDRLWSALTDLPTQLIHGDCNVGNVLVYDGEVSGYLDLDHLPRGPRVRDLRDRLEHVHERVEDLLHLCHVERVLVDGTELPGDQGVAGEAIGPRAGLAKTPAKLGLKEGRGGTGVVTPDAERLVEHLVADRHVGMLEESSTSVHQLFWRELDVGKGAREPHGEDGVDVAHDTPDGARRS